jgi:hypothetical protein
MKTGREKCDNAPIVKVPLGAVPKSFTLIMPYYENPDFFRKQIGFWRGLPEDLRQYMHCIIVDDGSPGHPAEQIVLEEFRWDRPIADFQLFRIEVDVRWNWLAARNIGAVHASMVWVMLTDMDHVLTAEVLKTLVYGQHDLNVIYRFSRREHSGEKIHPHPNSWFMTKAMFWKIGGYDERMSGYYGSDGYYRRRCAETAPIRIMADELVRYEKLGDSSTVKYLRKQPEDAKLKEIVRAFPKGSKPKILSFRYHKVQL